MSCSNATVTVSPGATASCSAIRRACTSGRSSIWAAAASAKNNASSRVKKAFIGCRHSCVRVPSPAPSRMRDRAVWVRANDISRDAMRHSNRQWILMTRPVGDIKPGDLELVEQPIPVPGPGQILVRTLYLSLDPPNRIWMSDMEQYMPPVNLGEVMRGGTLSVVEQSNNPDFKSGDVMNTFTGWQEYAVVDGGQKLPPGLPLPAYMSVLGATGATAYFGLLDLGKPEPGQTVVVSAAAGAVGQIVGQIAKIKGCRVVGIAGSDAKCKHLVNALGFDAAINYKTTKDMRAALKRECPNGN